METQTNKISVSRSNSILEMFKEADVNNDGQINLTEFLECTKERMKNQQRQAEKTLSSEADTLNSKYVYIGLKKCFK